MRFLNKIFMLTLSAFLLCTVFSGYTVYAEESEEESSEESVGSEVPSKMPVYYPGFKSAGESLASGEESEGEKESTESEESDKEEIQGKYDQEELSLFLENEESLFLKDYFDDQELDFITDLLEEDDLVSLFLDDISQTDVSLLTCFGSDPETKLWEFDPFSRQVVYFFTEGSLLGLPDYVIQEQGGWFRWADNNSFDPEHVDQIIDTGLHDAEGRQYAEHFFSQKYFYDQSGDCRRIEFYASCGNVGYELDSQEGIIGRYTYRTDLFDTDVDTVFFNDPYPYGWDPEITGHLVRDDFGRYFLCSEDGSKWLIIARAQGLNDGAEFLNSILLAFLAEQGITVKMSGYEYDAEYIYFDNQRTRILAVTEGEVLGPIPAENLYQDGLAELIDTDFKQEDIILESNGNIQEAELITDRENPQDQALSWQWQQTNDQEISWSRDFANLDLSAEDLSSLIVRAVVSGDAGSEFFLEFYDDQDRKVTAEIKDYLNISSSLQYLAVSLNDMAITDPDFNWGQIKELRCTAGSGQGKVVIQQLRICDVSEIKDRGISVGVFEDNDFSPINWWQGIKPAYVLSYKDLFDICSEDISGQISALSANGQIPYLTLEFWPMEAKPAGESDLQRDLFIDRYGQELYQRILEDTENKNILAGISSGLYDEVIRDYADAVAAVDSAVLLRIFHEFNGHWYPWTIETAGEADFISAWNRIHDIFRQQGADNALFVYSPFVLNTSGYDPVERILSSIKDKVDIIAFDGYGPSPDNPEGLSFNELFSELMLRLEKFNIPFMIGEFASESDKENFYTSLDNLLRSGVFPDLIGITYFDIAKYERGVWRDFTVDTIYRTVRDYQEDGFYRMTPGQFLETAGSYQDLSHYYWGGSLDLINISASVNDPQAGIEGIVSLENDSYSLTVSADTSQGISVYTLDLISGLLSDQGQELSSVTDKEQYLSALSQMRSYLLPLISVLINEEKESALLIDRYLFAVIFRLENPDVSTVIMPELPASVSTDSNGFVTIEFVSGILYPDQLQEFWTEVDFGTKVEYWDITPGALSAQGDSLNLQFAPELDGMTVSMKFYGIDFEGRQTKFTNAVLVRIDSNGSSLAMPVLPENITTSSQGLAEIVFVSGQLLPDQLSDLWAEVSYEGKTEYWDLHPSMLSSDGTSFSMQFFSEFNGKNILMRLYGFDTQGKKTQFTNSVSIEVISSPSQVNMPVLPAEVYTDTEGRAEIVFVSGQLLPDQLSDLWAEVSYEGKTEYWDLHPSMLSSDGLSFIIDFDPVFRDKILNLRLYGFDLEGSQTLFSNCTQVIIR